MRDFSVPLLKFLPNFLASLIVLLSLNAQTKKLADISEIPHLQKQGTATQLIVNKKPFLILGGELGNSSASDLEYIRPIWPKLVKMNLNSLLVPVYWELIEPEEGRFDFTLVDSLIRSARQYDLKIVFLWFGTWKNSMSCYVPYWVKIDQRRFPRARTRDGKAQEILSPLNEENRNADAHAFATLMKHIRTVDGNHQTVIMIQIENEIGMIPEARDHDEKAERLYRDQVPIELMSCLEKNKESLIPEFHQMWQKAGLKTSGTWTEVFGEGLQTDEIFMAWHFAKYANFVAQSGKEEYPLPMYVNAALIRPGYKPGQYPSGGPLPHLLDVWKAAAPEIDFLSPDIYFKSFAEWCGKYNRPGNPLFIPEVGNNQSVTNAFYAIAQHDALGYSPFSIESLDNPETNPISKGYIVLRQLAPLILQNQGKGTMAGVLLDSASQKIQVDLGEYTFNVAHEYSWAYAERSQGETPRAGGMIIMLSKDEFVIAGSGIIVTFEPRAHIGAIAGIGSLEEGSFVSEKWIPRRRLNGDQSHQGRHVHLPGSTFSIQKAILYKYK